MITQSELKELLNYDQDTGIFTWKISNSNRAIVGSVAGKNNYNGYLRIGINKKIYLAHRLAWLYIYGEFSKNCIDHVNGIRNDNRISNLREATYSQNSKNSKIPKTNKSGVKGVSWHNVSKKWMAMLRIGENRKYIGLFDDLNLAKIAIQEARLKYHGEYANNG